MHLGVVSLSNWLEAVCLMPLALHMRREGDATVRFSVLFVRSH